MPSRRVGQLLLADRTDPVLFTPQVVQLACSTERVRHLVGKPFLHVEFPGRVIRIGVRFDFDVALDGYPTGKKQPPFFVLMRTKEHPMACSHRFEVLPSNPTSAFMRMATFGPAPEREEDRIIHLDKGLFTHDMLMIVRPSPNNRVQLGDQHASGHGLLGFEDGADLGQHPLHTLLGRFDE